MKIIVSINNCHECRHIDHSGSFTIRGIRLICGHSNACKVRKTKDDFRKEYPEYIKRDGEEKTFKHWEYHWYNRILTKNSKDKIRSIPDWCPLKHGSKY